MVVCLFFFKVPKQVIFLTVNGIFVSARRDLVLAESKLLIYFRGKDFQCFSKKTPAKSKPWELSYLGGE